MKYLFALVIAFSSMHFDITAEEQGKASQTVIDEIKLECVEYAKEDQVSSEDLKEYLLTCVNDELVERGLEEVAEID